MLAELAKIVTVVGELLLQWRAAGRLGGKWDGPQFKADADLAAHEELVRRLAKLSPDIPVVSEEDASSWVEARPELYWLIDPIDGTASFVQHYSGFVTQVALMQNQTPTLAAIFAPALGSLYLAEQGRGAFLNGVSLLREPTFSPKTLIDNYPEPRGEALEAFTALQLVRYIECGGIALKICKIADNSADVFLKAVTVRDWDLAAPHLVLLEAGGMLTDLEGNPIVYTGEYTKTGIVAAGSKETINLVVNWHKGFMAQDEIRGVNEKV